MAEEMPGEQALPRLNQVLSSKPTRPTPALDIEEKG